MDITWLGKGAHMFRPGRAPSGEPGPANQNIFFPAKWLYYRHKILLSFISWPGGWSQMIPQVKKPDVEGLGWCGYTLWGWLDILPNSQIVLEAAYGREINIQFSGNRSGGHSCSQHANCTLPQLETSVALCDKTAHFRVAFYWPQHKVHLCNDHAV